MEYKSLLVGYVLGCSSMLLAQRVNKQGWRLFRKSKKSNNNDIHGSNDTHNSNNNIPVQTPQLKWNIYGYLYKYPDNVHIVERGVADDGNVQFRAISVENEYIDLTKLNNVEIDNDNIIAFDNGEEFIFTKSMPHIESMHGC